VNVENSENPVDTSTSGLGAAPLHDCNSVRGWARRPATRSIERRRRALVAIVAPIL
jgi:hypothetical protein